MLVLMLRQSFLQGRRRKALAAATVALAATLVTTLFALSVDIGDKMAREMKSYGSNIRVTPKSETLSLVVGGVDYNPLKGRDTLAEDDLAKIKDIFWRNNIVGLAPRLTLRVSVKAGPGPGPGWGAGAATAGQPGVPLTGTYFDAVVPLPDDPEYRTGVRTINPFWQVAGEWPDDGAADAVLAGRALAGRLGVKPGDSLTLTALGQAAGASRAVRVSGILTTGGTEDDSLVAPLAVAQALAGLPGRVQSVDVSALTIPENDLSGKARRDTGALTAEEYDTWYCTAYVSSIAHQIEEAVVNASARPLWQVAAGEGAVIGRIQTLLLVVSLAAVAAAAMGVSALMNTAIQEQAREIGLMKALGATAWQIHLLFIGEASVVGVIGGALGLGTGAGVAQAVGWSVFGGAVEIQPITVPVVLAVSVATVLAGSVLPARAITALHPVEVLHGR